MLNLGQNGNLREQLSKLDHAEDRDFLLSEANRWPNSQHRLACMRGLYRCKAIGPLSEPSYHWNRPDWLKSEYRSRHSARCRFQLHLRLLPAKKRATRSVYLDEWARHDLTRRREPHSQLAWRLDWSTEHSRQSHRRWQCSDNWRVYLQHWVRCDSQFWSAALWCLLNDSWQIWVWCDLTNDRGPRSSRLWGRLVLKNRNLLQRLSWIVEETWGLRTPIQQQLIVHRELSFGNDQWRGWS